MSIILVLLACLLGIAADVRADTDTRNPTGDGTFTGTWTAAPRWSSVNDHDDSTCTSVITHGTATAGKGTFTYTAFSVPAGATINNIQVIYRDGKNAAQGNSWGAFLVVNGTDQATNDAHNTSNGGCTERIATYTQNPATTAAWTVDQVNGSGANALSGFGVVATDANPSLNLGSIQLKVDYTPAAGGDASRLLMLGVGP